MPTRRTFPRHRAHQAPQSVSGIARLFGRDDVHDRISFRHYPRSLGSDGPPPSSGHPEDLLSTSAPDAIAVAIPAPVVTTVAPSPSVPSTSPAVPSAPKPPALPRLVMPVFEPVPPVGRTRSIPDAVTSTAPVSAAESLRSPVPIRPSTRETAPGVGAPDRVSTWSSVRGAASSIGFVLVTALEILDFAIAYLFLLVTGAILAPVAGVIGVAVTDLLPTATGGVPSPPFEEIRRLLLWVGPVEVGFLLLPTLVLVLPLLAIMSYRMRHAWMALPLAGAIAAPLGAPFAPWVAAHVGVSIEPISHGYAAAMVGGALGGLILWLIARDPGARRRSRVRL